MRLRRDAIGRALILSAGACGWVAEFAGSRLGNRNRGRNRQGYEA